MPLIFWLLSALRKFGHQAVHQLEVRRQRRRVLLRVVENLFAVALRVHRRAGAAVDEDELRPQDEAFALHVGARRDDAAAAEAVVDFLDSRCTKPEREFGVNSTVPVTISGFWYSSPILFQYAVLANSRSYGSRSFSSLMSFGSGSAWRGRDRRAGVAARTSDCSRAPARPRSSRALARLVLFLRDVDQRHDVGVDHLERRFRAELAAQQADRFLVRVDVFGAAGDEAGDEHALKRRDIQLRLDRRFDRDFEVVGAARATRERRARSAASAPSEPRRLLSLP